ncbi:MAG TPA: hypothetical protein VHX87_03800, partial [Galbitalea sp.]|nr:hypothetical protein [Galbitalea sp.]
ELMYRPSQVRLAQRDDPVQTFTSDREHEPLRVRVQVRTARRQPQHLHCVFRSHPGTDSGGTWALIPE